MAGLPRLTSPDQLKGVKLKVKEVDAPEWATDEAPEGYSVELWELTGDEVGEIRKSMLKRDRAGKWGADITRMQYFNSLVLVAAVRDRGQRIFADIDAPMLRKLGSAGTERLAAIAKEMSRLSDVPEDLDEEEKDSGPTTRPYSNSDSPATYIEQLES